MSDLQLIEAVKTGQLAKVEEALNAGADIHQQDEQGWTPLNWASGRGDLEIVRLLLDRGADVFRAGRDQRTPYKIALAARHAEVARLLKERELAVNRKNDDSPQETMRRHICLEICGSLAVGVKKDQLEGNHSRGREWRCLASSRILMSCFSTKISTVTQLIWSGENVIFNQRTPEWLEFCTRELQFRVPDDFDLIASTSPTQSAETA